MQEIHYLLPPEKVFTSSQRILLRNGFRIVSVSESSKEIRATKQGGLLGAKLSVSLSVIEKNGHSTLVIDAARTKGTLDFFKGKDHISADKLIDELNTHIR